MMASGYSDVKPQGKQENFDGERFADDSHKKILYFSDGVLEVDDRTDGSTTATSEPAALQVNPQELTWFPWMWHQTVTAGAKALEVCDYVGESLASFFGITTPKYQFEINEYLRLKKAEEEENQNEIELGNWTQGGDVARDGVANPISTKPVML